MTRLFRHSLSRLIGTGLACAAALSVSSAPAQAAPCGDSPTHEAFIVEGLKSELMVTALSCQAQDRYNAFVTKFLPTLKEAERQVDRYFRTTYGRRARVEHDSYITQLADVQSLGGLQSGTAFCDQRKPMFDEVEALNSTSADLAHYAAAKDVAQPASYESCEAPKLAPHTRRSLRARHRRHR